MIKSSDVDAMLRSVAVQHEMSANNNNRKARKLPLNKSLRERSWLSECAISNLKPPSGRQFVAVR